MQFNWNMYDQSMCNGGDCPLRWGCKRFLAQPTGRQDYFGSPPLDSDGTCKHFLPIRTVLRQYISTEDIQTSAYFISKENLTLDRLIWRFSETEFLLEKWLSGNFIEESDLTKERNIVKIKEIAYYKSLHKNLSLDALHWQLAERILIFNEIKARIQSVYGQKEKS